MQSVNNTMFSTEKPSCTKTVWLKQPENCLGDYAVSLNYVSPNFDEDDVIREATVQFSIVDAEDGRHAYFLISDITSDSQSIPLSELPSRFFGPMPSDNDRSLMNISMSTISDWLATEHIKFN